MALAFEIDLIAGIGRKDLSEGPLTNLTSGGDGTSGHRHSEATKELLRKFTTGRKLSEEHKAKIKANSKSYLTKGSFRSAETKAKISATLSGKPSGTKGKAHSAEWNAKVSAAHKGKVLSWEHKESLKGPRPSIQGVPKSEEHKAAMRKAIAAKPIRQCTYCDMTGRHSGMTRYHFENCKHRPDVSI